MEKREIGRMLIGRRISYFLEIARFCWEERGAGKFGGGMGWGHGNDPLEGDGAGAADRRSPDVAGGSSVKNAPSRCSPDFVLFVQEARAT